MGCKKWCVRVWWEIGLMTITKNLLSDIYFYGDVISIIFSQYVVYHSATYV